MDGKQVAVITLGDERREFYQSRIQIVHSERGKLLAALRDRYAVYMPDPVFSSRETQACMDEIRRLGIGCLVIHIPVWGTPSLAAKVAAAVGGPVLLLGNRLRQSSSIVCMLAAAGMLDQLGKKAVRLCGEVAEPDLRDRLCAFIDACNAAEALRRSKFCAFGGRSIGIGTGVADPSQWQALFGCEFDHCDQYEIVHMASKIDPQRVARHKKWLCGHLKGITFGGLFTEESLDLQIRGYLALKDTVAERGYDFIGLKCQQELSDHFALQCLSISLLNNDRDADGPKKPTVCACECDCDGAMTMKMLSLLSGGKPVNLADIKYFDEEKAELILANCGGMAFHFAQRPDGAAYDAYMMEHVFGKAGGGSVQMVARPGEVTVARLFRSAGAYKLACFQGEAFEVPRERLHDTTYCYPHAFIKADIDYGRFFQTINSNHLHTVYGKYGEALRFLCDILGIGFISYDRSC